MSQWKISQLLDLKFVRYLLNFFGLYPKAYTEEPEPAEILSEDDLNKTFRKIRLAPKACKEKIEPEKKSKTVWDIEAENSIERLHERYINNWKVIEEYGNNIIKRTRHCSLKRYYTPDAVIVTLECGDVTLAQGWKMNESLDKYELASKLQASNIGYKNETVRNALEYQLSENIFNGRHNGKTIDFLTYKELLL